jgi:hypothetical protein
MKSLLSDCREAFVISLSYGMVRGDEGSETTFLYKRSLAIRDSKRIDASTDTW